MHSLYVVSHPIPNEFDLTFLFILMIDHIYDIFFISKNGCVEGIIQRLKTYKDPTLPHEIKVWYIN